MNNKTLPRITADIEVKGPARRHQHGASPATLPNFLIVENKNTHAPSVSKLHSSNQSFESATTSLFMGLGHFGHLKLAVFVQEFRSLFQTIKADKYKWLLYTTSSYSKTQIRKANMTAADTSLHLDPQQPESVCVLAILLSSVFDSST